MKRTISLLFIIVLIGCSSSKNTDKILIEVFERDQYIRNQMIELTKAVSKEGRTDLIDSLINIYNQTQLIDSQNIAVIVVMDIMVLRTIKPFSTQKTMPLLSIGVVYGACRLVRNL